MVGSKSTKTRMVGIIDKMHPYIIISKQQGFYEKSYRDAHIRSSLMLIPNYCELKGYSPCNNGIRPTILCKDFSS